MSKIHEFSTAIYPRRLWITRGMTGLEMKDMFKEPEGDELKLNLYDCDAFAYNVRKKHTSELGILIWFDNISAMTTSNIAHESVHAAMEIFNDLDCKFDANNQEPLAYLVGWIADCIDQVKRNKFKI